MVILGRWSNLVVLLAALASAQSAATSAPVRLAALANAFLDSRSAASELHLREFAAAEAKNESGSLAYFVLGFAHWQDKQFPQAAGYLRLARVARSPLSDYADYYLASALQNEGDHASAIPVLSDFEARHPDSPLINRARYALAVGLVATDAPAAALKILNAHLGAFSRPAADLLMARAYEAAGDSNSALRIYSDVYYGHPSSPEAEEAAKHKADFPKPSPVLLEARADSLMAAKKYTEAQAAYKTLAAVPKSPQREHAEVALGAVLYKLNRPVPARAALEALEPETPEASAERLYWLSEIDRHLKREQDMLDDFHELEKQYAGSKWLEEALYSIGNYELVRNGIEKAAPYYAMLSKRFPDGRYGAQSHWKVAWARYRAGDYESARYLMVEQIKEYPNSVLTPAALYWSGRIAETADAPGAQGFFRRAVEGFPNNFYGLRSRERLTAPPGRVGMSYAAPAAPPDAAPRRKQFELMRSLGLADLASAEIRQVIQSAGKFQAFWWLDLAAMEKENGRLYVAIDSARRAVPLYTQLDPDSVPRSVWDLLYPLPWWNEVREEAAREGLDPYLVAGLIRQESLFNEHVISHAKAYGLMQILPSTGRQLARKMGVAPYSTASLFIPRINIKMGVHYLKQLIDSCDGRVEDALAAYNAGESRQVNWRRPGFKDPTEFIESIPFSETREYVQIVLRNAAVYRRLYPGSGTPPGVSGTAK
jgi:soluble lytic murein transglycosylase